MTSYPNRTSPVLRGKWLLENILGTPPPPPPPDVPALKDKGANGERRSVRERLEEHRKNPVCASCHAQMDPLGFALEHFDAHRQVADDRRGSHAVDASGSLPGGTAFEGLAGLRSLLLTRREQFVGTVSERLLSYALGRGVEYYDRPAVRRIVRDREARRLPLVVDHPRDRRERAVSDAENRVMISPKKAIPRRTVLRGLGATLALPLLDSMVPAFAAARPAATPVKRLGVVYVPNGMVHEAVDAGCRRRRLRVHADPASRSSRFAISCWC